MMFQRIRDAVRRIPRGKVSTYGEVARAAGFPGAARQVVWALHGAGVGLPWHRVVGAGGRILLPGESGFEQRARLAAEGIRFRGDRIPLDDFGFAFAAGRRRAAVTAPRSRATGKRSRGPRPRR